jgi:MerR family mercuric resistance operon transcriptional regulator
MTRTISKVANAAGINIETVRFYERKKLIAQPTKPTTGFRHYPDETLARIHFIKRAQELGFTLDEVSNLLSLNDRPCSQVQELAEQKLSAVKEKLANLSRLEEVLQSLLAQCHNNDDENRCPIIHSLQPL